jgi:catechol 2,3-dioxygenase-like lactoylglutathione lyase family enzyme
MEIHMITQLAHINIFSDQAKEMVDFYTHKLGLKIAFTLDNDKGIPFGWYIECGKMTFIEIFDQAGAVRQWGGAVWPHCSMGANSGIYVLNRRI